MQSADTPSFQFVVYSVNRRPEMIMLMDRLRVLIEGQMGHRVSIEIIDVLEDPERAIAAEIFATPTLVKDLPKPIQRLLGDLSDPQKIVAAFGLIERKTNDGE